MNGTMVIGLTGGIGSGKSTAADCFRAFGIPVLDADLYSRSALQPNTPCFVKTVALFGTKCLLPDGTVDRRFIATRIF
ncbi:MAG: dephospho-CoA kinase, partial [Clostridia bacterium]|nr:dephospho-CoA kinase [Clostridia bacterium]